MAGRAHGVVTRAELLAAGITKAEIDGRLRTGAFIAVFRGVYRVGHKAPSVEARYMAALKACGEGTLLSGLSAAWLWGLVKGHAPPPEVAARTERRIKGVKVRRVRRLGKRDGLARCPGDYGGGVHKTRHAWEQDREREREARRRGDVLRRYTWRDVFEEPDQMLAELDGFLA
jgi:hypothetical protein